MMTHMAVAFAGTAIPHASASATISELCSTYLTHAFTNTCASNGLPDGRSFCFASEFDNSKPYSHQTTVRRRCN